MWNSHPRHLQQEWLQIKHGVFTRVGEAVGQLHLAEADAAEWSGQAREAFDKRLADIRESVNDAGNLLNQAAAEAWSALQFVRYQISIEGQEATYACR